MDRLDFDFFFAQLKLGKYTDDVCFCFADDPDENEHYLGFQDQREHPYWVGYCDVPDGAVFDSAEELVDAEIFDGKSLRTLWNDVRITSVWGCSLEDWLEATGLCKDPNSLYKQYH